MSDYVYPNCLTVVAWNGNRVRLNPNQQWRADDPFVKARPEFFDVDPVQVAQSTQPERMTARPGERRTTPPRTKKSAPAKKAQESDS